MKKTLLFYRKALFIKIALLAALIVGGGNTAWADTVVVEGNTINSPWETTDASISGKYPGSSSTTPVSAFSTNNEEYIYGSSNYSWYYLHTTEGINVSTGQKIIINTRSANGASQGSYVGTPEIKIRYSTDNSTWTVLKEFTSANINTSGTFSDIQTEDLDIQGQYFFQIFGKGVYIASIIIQDSSTPILSVSSTNVSMGRVIDDTSETITVSNTGASSLNVTLSNSNSTNFSISDSSLSGITNGSSQSFDVTFDYSSAEPGVEKSTTITVTPNVGNPIEITVTATALNDNAPELSVTPDGDVNLGTTYSGNTTYTVTNIGTGSMTVNIVSDNSDFVISPTTIEGLGDGESETFTITYTFASTAEKLGLNSANITVTPTYDEDDVKTFVVSATSYATFTLDEDTPSSPGYGTKNYLHVKYQPSNGWNTLSMPFVLYNSSQNINFMNALFGEGWKVYTLNAYNNGILTFKKLSANDIVQNGVPYLVYVASAPNHTNGVLLQGAYTQGNNSGSTTKSGATFQGTYVTKTYAENDNWYGVTPAGKVMKAGTGAAIKGYRAYFTGVSAPSADARVTIVIEDDDTSDLGFVKMVDENATDVYTLSGQKVQKGGKGIYIVNGRKVVIK